MKELFLIGLPLAILLFPVVVNRVRAIHSFHGCPKRHYLPEDAGKYWGTKMDSNGRVYVDRDCNPLIHTGYCIHGA